MLMAHYRLETDKPGTIRNSLHTFWNSSDFGTGVRRPV